jgi:hypothetical protein
MATADKLARQKKVNKTIMGGILNVNEIKIEILSKAKRETGIYAFYEL